MRKIRLGLSMALAYLIVLGAPGPSPKAQGLVEYALVLVFVSMAVDETLELHVASRPGQARDDSVPPRG